MDPWLDGVREGLRRHEGERSNRSRYEVLGEIGSGAMGVVFRARDLKLGRAVALKILQSTNAEDAKRFVREGQLAAQLSHPHIVPVYEVGELDGRHFIAMELVEGTPLSGRRFEPRKAAAILRDAAEAVHYAHGQGIIHRDLKPENIMLTDTGHVWVMDFGLARPLGRGRTMTAAGAVMGTPNYMPPEQADGERCDARSDVYSLGATLWALLHGRPPFGAASALAVLDRVRTDEIEPPRVDRDLATILLKAMEKVPEKRYASAREMADDLTRYLEGVPILAARAGLVAWIVRRIRRHPTATAVAAIAIALALAFPAYSVVRSRRQAAERDRLVREAAQARAVQEWAKAAGLFAEASKLAPDDASIRSQRRAMEEMGRTTKAWKAREDLLQRTAGTVPPTFIPHELPSKKEPLWQTEDALAAAKREISLLEQEAEQAALVALSLDPTLDEARRILTELYQGRYEEAENPDTLRWWAERIRVAGGEEALERIRRPAMLTLATKPAGATAYLFRYEERRRRLLPHPCDPLGETREPEIVSVDAVPWDSSEEEKRRVRKGSAYPLETSENNRTSFPVPLPPGSYLVLFQKAGYADARYPVLLERGSRAEATVRLLRADAIPDGFVYVPAGRAYVMREALTYDSAVDTRDLAAREIGGFLISRFSVGAGAYLEFLNDRTEHSLQEAVARSPRFVAPGADGRMSANLAWVVRDDTLVLGNWKEDEPVGGISQLDASKYADWYTRRHGQGKWRFRIPTMEEWERAARGADRRRFPWGDTYEPAFAAAALSRNAPRGARSSPMERIGLFPADESPFGVRDLAGVVANWTDTPMPGSRYWICKGGDYFSGGGPADICATGFNDRAYFSPSIGIRLVADVPEE